MHLLRLTSLLFLFQFLPFSTRAQTSPIDVLNYEIHVSNINLSAKTISANTFVKLTAVTNSVSSFDLTLLHLTIDSIISSNQQINYTYNDTTISISPASILNTGDTVIYNIYYHGQPQMDPSGWGGFYFDTQTAFNLGVGFNSDPHNLGKAWFPCQDNFSDRAYYHFYITTDSISKAFCNGTLISQTLNTNGTITWEWDMNKRIPTYLASMAVSHYYTFQRNYQNIPVQIACLPGDSNAVAGTFHNLDSVLSNYIYAYGPYPFSKVGYCLVPFNSGAMEHATSIHIGRAFVNGSLTYETLWAHELSHMWFGDKVTCETEGDMWLNEGFASYNENFTTQKLYGQTAYINAVRSKHRQVLQFTHVKDGAYYPLINIPHAITYGSTVYDKGADIVHTLRYYLGDSAFFNGCKYYLSHRNDGNANSTNLRDDLTFSTGINMNRFFDDWVFTPGFPHFSIDSVTLQQASLNHYTIFTRQRSRGNNHLYEMPVEITFTNGVVDKTVTVLIDSTTNVFHIAIPFIADMIAVDRNEKISDAISSNEKKIFSTGSIAIAETGMSVNVQTTGIDSTILRVEHNFVAPDNFKTPHPGIRLSDYHYWKIDGIFSNGFYSKATFNYNGSLSQTSGCLDNTLITGIEDSLLIFYRTGCADDWQLVNGYLLQKSGSNLDKIGSFIVDTLKKGEYCFGYYDYTTGISAVSNSKVSILTVFPNPSRDTFTILVNDQNARQYKLKIANENGALIYDGTIISGTKFNWRPPSNSGQLYFISIYDRTKLTETKKVTFIH